MKKKIFAGAILLSVTLFSCAKERTCKCTTISSYTSNYGGQTQTQSNPPSTTTTKYTKAKKSDLGTTCGDTKNSGTSAEVYNGQTATTTYNSETTCTIE